MAAIRCSAPGKPTTCRSAVIVKRARSCRLRRTSNRRRGRPTSRSSMRCSATSAAAALRPRPKTIASGRVSRCDGVVPFWMEGVASYVEGRHLLVGDFYTFRIVGIEFAAGRQTGFRRGVRDQCDGDEHAGERRSTPSLGYVAEHAMLDLVPLRRPRRIMADLESQGCLIGELLERHLPEPKPGTVRTAAVGRDHQAGHRGIPIPTHPIQPKPNAVDGELPGIMVDSQTDIALIS